MRTNDTNDQVDLEKAFDLIKEGNSHENSNRFWDASECFDLASRILKQLSGIEYASPIEEAPEEHQKISILYKQKSIEYFHRARDSLIRAMTNEKLSDRSIESEKTQSSTNNFLTDQCHISSISEEECYSRVSLFGRLFAKDPELLSQFKNLKYKTPDEHASSLENRLMELNSSLPPTLKTDAERLREINRGLGRLGLSMYSPSDDRNIKPFRGALNVDTGASETDQIANLIAQVKDEVSFPDSTATDTNLLTGTEKVVSSKMPNLDLDTSSVDLSDENESSIENELDEENEEAQLPPETCKDIQSTLVEAQAAIAELIAMFDVDSGGDAQVHFDQESGKQALKKARIYLLQATKKWN